MSGPPEPAGQARCSGICDRQINFHLCYVHEETERGAEVSKNEGEVEGKAEERRKERRKESKKESKKERIDIV